MEGYKMDDKTKRLMNSVGTECFIEFFTLFSRDWPASDKVAELQDCKGYTTTGCRTRVSCAKRIIRNPERLTAVLNYIANDALKVRSAVRNRATVILGEFKEYGTK
jgi:hypothetical protein